MMDRWHVALAAALAVISGSASPHHSMDLTDAAPIRVEGYLEFVSWDGAHVVYEIRGTDANGDLRSWAIMGASPRILRSRGLEKTTFKVGDRITVTGRLDPHTNFIAPDYFITANSASYEMGFYPSKVKPK